MRQRNYLEKKNQDYGDAFANYGTVGVLVRLGDKISRLQSISSRGINLVEDEKIRDTLIDLHNYAAMGIMLLDEKNDEPILEDNNEKCEYITWGIYGSTGTIYKRTQIRKGNKVISEKCSCPSFQYRGFCKHINDHNNYSVVLN